MRGSNSDWSRVLILRVSRTRALWFWELMGMISVFSMLNFAPETSHQERRIKRTRSKRSVRLR